MADGARPIRSVLLRTMSDGPGRPGEQARRSPGQDRPARARHDGEILFSPDVAARRLPPGRRVTSSWTRGTVAPRPMAWGSGFITYINDRLLGTGVSRCSISDDVNSSMATSRHPSRPGGGSSRGGVGVAGRGSRAWKTGRFPRSSPPSSYAAGTSPAGIAVADFNGDGKSDMAVVNNAVAGTVGIMLSNGDGTFQPKVDYAAGAEPARRQGGRLQRRRQARPCRRRLAGRERSCSATATAPSGPRRPTPPGSAPTRSSSATSTTTASSTSPP